MVQIAADRTDYRDGFLTFNVIDTEKRYVFDAITTDIRSMALHELRPKPIGFVEERESFLFVENPVLPVVIRPA